MSNKTNIGNAVTMEQILEFNVAFPEEEILTVEQYLAGGSRNMIFNIAAFFLGFKNHKSKFIPFSMFIDKYFHKQNLWKLPPLLEIVAPALFKEEYEIKEASKS